MDHHSPVTDEIVKDLKQATSNLDGETVVRILEEVGPCGWSSLTKKANKDDNTYANLFPNLPAGLYVIRQGDNLETGTWFIGTTPVTNLGTSAPMKIEKCDQQ